MPVDPALSCATAIRDSSLRTTAHSASTPSSSRSTRTAAAAWGQTRGCRWKANRGTACSRRSMTLMRNCSSPLESEFIGSALARIARNPVTIFIRQWNWKAALLSAAIRGLPYTVVLLRYPADEMRGAGLELAFRFLSGGSWGSLMQAMRHSRPAWLAGLAIAIGIPVTSQALEFAVLTLGGASHIRSAMVVSAIFG